MKIDVCIETVFDDQPVEKRIELVAKAGYSTIEFWFHDGTACGANFDMTPKSADVINQVCVEYGVTVNNLVVNGPDGAIGGAPVNSGDLQKYLERVEEVITFAKSINCHKGITCAGNCQPGLSRLQMHANLEKAYGLAAEIAAKRQFTLVVEPLNTHVDHAGYYLDSSDEGAELVRAINNPSFKLLYDVYHMQIMEGNLISNITRHIDLIGHFHAAGVPGRHELFTGEINYQAVVKQIEDLGYQGCFGLEYFPAMQQHSESLCKTLAYLKPVLEC